jgi:uncharacterized protein YkwD
MFIKLTICALVLAVGGDPESDSKPERQATEQVTQETQPQAEQKAASPTDPAAKTEEQSGKSADTAEPAQAVAETRDVNGVKMDAIEINIVSFTNKERARFGLPPLEIDKGLMESARQHAAWMTRNHSMTHTSRPVAENIAMGQPHSSDVVRAWMNSPGHRANILNLGHRHIGVAAFRTEGGTIFWCQQFRQ